MAFTEHGAIMAAAILNSPRAMAMSVYVIRVFVRLRNELLANTTLEKRLASIEKTLLTHDAGLRDIYNKIRPLLLPRPKSPGAGLVSIETRKKGLEIALAEG